MGLRFEPNVDMPRIRALLRGEDQEVEKEEQTTLVDQEEGEEEAEPEERRGKCSGWRGRQKRDMETKGRAERSKDRYEFAAITNGHKLSGIK